MRVTRAGVGTTVTTSEIADGSVTAAKLAEDYDRDLGLAGMYAGFGFPSGLTIAALTTGRAYFARFVPSRNMTISSLSFALTLAAGADDPVDVGIFNGALTTKLTSAGATLGKLTGATGPKNVDFADVALTAGTAYYAAFSVGVFGGSAATVWMYTNNAGAVADMPGTAAGTRVMGVQVGAHPLVAPVTLASSGNVPVMFLHEA